jgi:TetR/AcrR family transcriptional repressor of nem operon
VLVRYPKEQKGETRQRILEAAGKLFREHGYNGIGVDAIMAEAGLTAGGFYAHFQSKEELFAEAIASAFRNRGNSLRSADSNQDDAEWLKNLIYGYLSRTHRDMIAEGCPLPSITPDVMRGSEQVRASYEKSVRQFTASIIAHLEPGESSEKERALAIIAQCIGGLMMARAVNDEELSNQLLKASRQAAMKIVES